MKNLTILALSLFLLSCGSNYQLDSLSDYTITQDALADETKVRVLQLSKGPSPTENVKCYYQYLIQDVETDKLYRLFCPFIHKLGRKGEDKIFTYASMQSPENKRIVDDLRKRADIENIHHVVHVDMDEDIAKLPIVIGILFDILKQP